MTRVVYKLTCLVWTWPHGITVERGLRGVLAEVAALVLPRKVPQSAEYARRWLSCVSEVSETHAHMA